MFANTAIPLTTPIDIPLIVGIVGGIVALLVIIAIVVFLVLRRGKNEQQTAVTEPTTTTTASLRTMESSNYGNFSSAATNASSRDYDSSFILNGTRTDDYELGQLTSFDKNE
jgi:hypothetical protein